MLDHELFLSFVFTRNFHREFESVKFNNYILAKCHETSRTVPHILRSHDPQQNCTFSNICQENFNILHMLIKINHLQNKTFTDLQLYVKIV